MYYTIIYIFSGIDTGVIMDSVPVYSEYDWENKRYLIKNVQGNIYFPPFTEYVHIDNSYLRNDHVSIQVDENVKQIIIEDVGNLHITYTSTTYTLKRVHMVNVRNLKWHTDFPLNVKTLVMRNVYGEAQFLVDEPSFSYKSYTNGYVIRSLVKKNTTHIFFLHTVKPPIFIDFDKEPLNSLISTTLKLGLIDDEEDKSPPMHNDNKETLEHSDVKRTKAVELIYID